MAQRKPRHPVLLFSGRGSARITSGQPPDPGDGAVLQDEAGDADAAAFTDVGVDGAILPQGQVDFQVGKACGQVLEVDLRLGFAEAVQGVQGVRTQVASDDGDFHDDDSFYKVILMAFADERNRIVRKAHDEKHGLLADRKEQKTEQEPRSLRRFLLC